MGSECLRVLGSSELSQSIEEDLDRLDTSIGGSVLFNDLDNFVESEVSSGLWVLGF